MLKRLASFLKVRPGEGRTVSLLAALMVSAFAGMGMGGSGIDALFFSRAGVAYLPTMYMVLGVVTLVTMLIISALLGSVDQRALYVSVPLLLAILLIAERAVLLLGYSWFYPVMWLVKGVMASFQSLSIWGLAGAICDTRQTKRLFPLFSAGTILGTAIGSSFTPLVVGYLHSENLILVWAASLGLSYSLGRALIAGMPPTAMRTSHDRQPGIIAEMRQGFEFVRKSQLLVLITIAAFLFSIAWFSLEFPFNSAATAAYPDEDTLAGFLGIFSGIITAAALGISLFGANRLFARFGIMPMLFTFPLIYLAAFVILPFAPSFALIATFRFAQIGWASGVAGTAWQAMFNVIPAHRRDQARAFIGGVPEQAGVLVAGGLLNIAQQLLEPQQIFWIGLGATIPILFVLWRAIGAYRASLLDALRAGQPQVFYDEEERFGGFARDAAAVTALAQGVTNPDHVIRLVSIEILGHMAVRQAASALLEALDDPDATVRVEALKALARTGDDQSLFQAAKSLTDVDAEVRLAAVDALSRRMSVPDHIREILYRLLADPVAAVRARAALTLIESEPLAREALHGLAIDRDPDARASAIDALGEWGDITVLPLILKSMGDPVPSVRESSARALAHFDQPEALDALTASLADPARSVRQAAAQALGAVGRPALNASLAALADPRREAGALTALEYMPVGDAVSALRAYARERTSDALHYYRLWSVIAAQGADARVALLSDSLLDKAQRFALLSLQAAGLLGDRSGIALAIENLKSANPAQRSNALEALEAMSGAAEIIRPLLQILDPKEPEPAKPTDALLQVMQERDSWLRACAALMAADSDHWEIRAALQELFESDPDPLVQEAAELSLSDDIPQQQSRKLSAMEQIIFLRRVSLFSSIAPAELRDVARITDELHYDHQAMLGKQGEEGDRAYIITSGQVRVVVSASGRKPVEVARRGVGDIIGEMSIISDEPRMAALIAEGSVSTLTIGRNEFTHLLRERPHISLAVMKVLCARIKERSN